MEYCSPESTLLRLVSPIVDRVSTKRFFGSSSLAVGA
jgi:hypothetical protein